MAEDYSNGYDALADDYIAARSSTGRDIIARWAKARPAGGTVLDIGAGHGEPVTAALIKAGLEVCAIDASPRMVAAFQQSFPGTPIRCEAAEDSTFFDQTFDGIVMIGLMFLLGESAQMTLISRIAEALKLGGSVLFSAPIETGSWTDILTGQPSLSLGYERYQALLSGAGLVLREIRTDTGGSCYYQACKPD